MEKQATVDSAAPDAGFVRDPYPMYANMRRHLAPVFTTMTPTGMKIWVVTGHDAAKEALAHPSLGKSLAGAAGIFNQDTMESRNFAVLPAPLRDNLLSTDQPDHGRMRRALSRAFTVRKVEALRPRIEQLTDELLDSMTGTVDLVEQFATTLPLKVLCELLGLSESDSPLIQRWAQTMLAVSMLPTETVAVDSQAFHDYVQNIVEARRAQPGDDLISALVSHDELSTDEVISLVCVLIIGGFETTAGLISNAVLALLCNPVQLADLRAHPELVGSAVNELVRFDGPAHTSTFRYTTEDITIGGVEIPAGEPVFVYLNSANRDETVFENADRLDIRRDSRRHVGFGHGAHYCIGAALARMETEIALSRLLARFPNLRLAQHPDDLRWRMSMLTRGLEALPLHTT